MWRRPACQSLSKGLDISSATARVAPDLLKDLAILSDRTIRRSGVDREDLKPYWKSGHNLLNWKHKASVKMCKWDLITFVRISKSWHAFDELRFDVSFSISGFEILKYLILKHLFVLVLLIGSSLWFIFPGL